MRKIYLLMRQVAPAKPTVLMAALLCSSITAWSMDLLQAYEAAKRQDATILAARASATAAKERLPQARAQLLPGITLSLSQNNNNLTSTALNSLGSSQVSRNDYLSSNRTLSIRQPLFRPYLLAQLRQAGAQVTDSDSNLETGEQDLAVRVCSAYFEAVLTYEQIALVRAQVDAYATQLDAARKALAAGSGTRTDVDEAQSRLDIALAQEFESRQNIEYTVRQLQVMVNEPIGELSPLDVSKLDLQLPESPFVEDWIEQAEKNSPELRMLKARLESAREEVNKAQWGHYPTLDALVQWSHSTSENVTNINTEYINTSVGLQLNIPLYGGGYVSSQVRQALAGQEFAVQTLESDRRDLSMRVQKEFRGMTENIPKVRALEQAVKSSEQTVFSSTKSLAAGSRTVMDVFNAVQQTMGVRRDLAQARFMYLISKIKLLALVGKADTTAVSEINKVLQH